MSVPNQTPYNIYTANGLTTVFAYQFMIMNAGDIEVSINGTPQTSGYTVQGAGQTGGGQVVFMTPPANGSVVMLLRKLVIKRDTDYQDNGDLLAETINADFDRLWLAMQQAFLSDSLSLKRPLLGGPYNAGGLKIVNLQDPTGKQDAATKGWVDLQYSVPTSEAKQAAEEAKQARDETVEVAEKFGDVDNAITIAIDAKESAQHSASAAQTAQQAAEVARDQAEAIADTENTFPSEEAGAAVTADGGYFRVPGGPDGTYSFKYYQMVSGVAVLVAVEMNGMLFAPLENLARAAEYGDNSAYERTGVDSAIVDKNYRWLALWRGDLLTLKNLNIINALNVKIANIGKMNAEELSLGGLVFSFASGAEYTRSPADSAILDKNYRWLLYWRGDMLNLKNLAVKYGLTAGTLDTGEVSINGVRAPLDYLNPEEYARSPYDELIVDKNLRIMQFTDYDGHVVIAGRLINPEPSACDSYEVYADAGKLYRVNKTTSDRELIDSNTDNSNVQNAPEIFTFDSNRDDTVIGNKWFSAYSPYKPAAYFGRRAIVGFGHSFMANPRFLRTLSDLTGLPTYNFGRSGGLSRTVALREGSYTVSYTPVGGSIPASGSVVLTPADPGVLQVVGNASLNEVVKGNIAGVDGSLAWDGTTLTFTRDVAGAAVGVSSPAPFIYYPYTIDSTNTVESGVRYDDHGDAINLLWLGRNNATQYGQVLSDAKAIIEHLTAHNKRFVLLPEFQMASEVKGTYGNGGILYLNSEYKKLAPDNYCEIDGVDLLANFNAHYNPAYAQDVTDIANGITPTSLRQDSLHPSQTLQANALYIGADVNAQFVYQFLIKKGWL
ncbi:hypothetical protein L473_02506 [Klebsiella pneumoniae BIDMC 36]|uniref:hypothetical protein n=1 Tax=Klebsiella pneumoniae TaxID=573 RepID=UPI0003BE3880|nr:hypothetical protein [Klebsiella pneumoniae]ESL36616.1 hypothetical protein L473_02506 [Klebsiella pneumoniae BIDMC 36]